MEEESTTKKREEYKTTIGPQLKKILIKQKEKIKKITLNCVNASDYEAGEIIAIKVIEEELI